MAITLSTRPSVHDGEQSALAVDRWHPIVASNRAPIEYALCPEGELVAKQAGGGVATALGGLAGHLRFTWVASAAGEGDRLAATRPATTAAANPRLRFVVLPPDLYEYHYNLFSNPLLWFLQHSLWTRLSGQAIEAGLTTGWMAGYLPANVAFALTIAGEARRNGGRPVVLLQDYHLYLVAEYLRRMLPAALLQHFVHIPWPAPAAWRVLPPEIRRAIFRSLLANDIVGFQTARDARRFVEGCATFLPQAEVDSTGSRVALGDHQTQVRAYPISIDVAALQGVLASLQVAGHHKRLRALAEEKTIVRVDRLDPSKDVPNGFRAFDRLLEEHPEWRGRVKFLAFLVPSRTGIPEYRRYAEETFALVAAINARHGRDGYRPIEVFYENDRPQAMAGLQLYDVLLVNPLADGMNLVAKEGPMANERDGVLVLSEGAGAHEQLRTGALTVAPGDIAGMADALARALDMPAVERRRRAVLLRNAVTRADLGVWLSSQLDDLARLRDAQNVGGRLAGYSPAPAWAADGRGRAHPSF